MDMDLKFLLACHWWISALKNEFFISEQQKKAKYNSNLKGLNQNIWTSYVHWKSLMYWLSFTSFDLI